MRGNNDGCTGVGLYTVSLTDSEVLFSSEIVLAKIWHTCDPAAASTVPRDEAHPEHPVREWPLHTPTSPSEAAR